MDRVRSRFQQSEGSGLQQSEGSGLQESEGSGLQESEESGLQESEESGFHQSEDLRDLGDFRDLGFGLTFRCAHVLLGWFLLGRLFGGFAGGLTGHIFRFRV